MKDLKILRFTNIIALLTTIVLTGCPIGSSDSDDTEDNDPNKTIEEPADNTSPNDSTTPDDKNTSTDPDDSTPPADLHLRGKWLYIDTGVELQITSEILNNSTYEIIDDNFLRITEVNKIRYLMRSGINNVRVSGQVASLDSSGSNKPGARKYNGVGGVKVVLRNLDDEELDKEIETNEEGRFDTNDVVSGNYSVEIPIDGEPSIELPDVEVEGNEVDLGIITLTESGIYNFKSEAVFDDEYMYTNKVYKGFIKVNNIGDTDGVGLSYEIKTDSSVVNELIAEQSLGTVPAGSFKEIPVTLRFNDITNQSGRAEVKISVTIRDAQHNQWDDLIVFDVYNTLVQINIDTDLADVNGYLVVPGHNLVDISTKSTSLNVPYQAGKSYSLVLSNSDLTKETPYSVGVGKRIIDFDGFNDTSAFEPTDGAVESESNAHKIKVNEAVASYLHAGDVDFYLIDMTGDSNVPLNVNATAGDGNASISWSEVPGASSYTLYWSTNSGVSKVSNEGVFSSVQSPFTHSALTNGEPYFYVVTATIDDAESDVSSEVSARPNSAGNVLTLVDDDMESDFGDWFVESHWSRIEDSDCASGARCWSVAPSGVYVENTNAILEMAEIDTRGIENLRLNFWHKYGLHLSDYGYVEVSEDDGSTWEQVTVYGHGRWQSHWAQASIDISDYVNNRALKIRFRFQSADYDNRNDVSWGWLIDNVEVNTLANSTTLPFDQNMEVDEKLFLTDSHWVITDSESDCHSGDRCWMVSPNENYTENTIANLETVSFDTTSLKFLRLMFWHKYGLHLSDYGLIEVSQDNGNSWEEVKRFGHSQFQNDWTQTVVDLSDFVDSPNVRVRFRFQSADYDNRNDTSTGWFIDDVAIIKNGDVPTSVVAWPGTGSIDVSWNSVPGADSYNLYWSSESGVDKATGTLIEDVVSPYVQNDIPAGQKRYYVATAVVNGSETSESKETNASAILNKPENVSLEVLDGKFRLNWDSVIGADSYNIYWANTADVSEFNFEGIIQSIDATNYEFDTVTDGLSYYFVVSAVNQYGESKIKPILYPAHRGIYLKSPTNVQVTAESNEVTVSWESVTGAETYNIYWQEETGISKETGTLIENVSSPYRHSELDEEKRYVYIVTAVNGEFESNASSDVQAIFFPSTPTGLTADSANDRITVRWTNQGNADSYNLYWSDTAGFDSNSATKVLGIRSPYTHSGVELTSSYFYKVSAVNIRGESDISVEVNGKAHSTVFSIDFENGWGDWYADQGIWNVGSPGSGPNECFDGLKCAATVLDGNYAVNNESRLISPLISLPSVTTDDLLVLRFRQWVSMGAYDAGRVQIKIETEPGVWSEWETLESYTSSSSSWGYSLVDISQHADKNIQLSFWLDQGNSGSPWYRTANGLGWYLDDVEILRQDKILITPSITSPYLENFEVKSNSWAANNSIWELGLPSSGPNQCFSGTACYATSLKGNYAEHNVSRLISPRYQLPTIAAGEQIQLRFNHWAAFGAYDTGRVQVRYETETAEVWSDWETVTSYTTTSNEWSYPLLDLSSYADKQIEIGFYLDQNNSGSPWYRVAVGLGWYIDDIEISIK